LPFFSGLTRDGDDGSDGDDHGDGGDVDGALGVETYADPRFSDLSPARAQAIVSQLMTDKLGLAVGGPVDEGVSHLSMVMRSQKTYRVLVASAKLRLSKHKTASS